MHVRMRPSPSLIGGTSPKGKHDILTVCSHFDRPSVLVQLSSKGLISAISLATSVEKLTTAASLPILSNGMKTRVNFLQSRLTKAKFHRKTVSRVSPPLHGLSTFAFFFFFGGCQLLYRKYDSGAVGTFTHVVALQGTNYSCELEVYADGYCLR